MDGEQVRGERERGSSSQIGQTCRRLISPFDSDIQTMENVCKSLRGEMARLAIQLKEEVDGLEREYSRLIEENEGEYNHHISILEMNMKRVMLNHYLAIAWRQQPDSHVPEQLLRPACAGSEHQTGFLHPYQAMSPSPPSASFLGRLLEITNERHATTSAFYHGTGMIQQNTEPQPGAQHVDMMPNYWLTTESFLTSNFDQSWWSQWRQ